MSQPIEAPTYLLQNSSGTATSPVIDILAAFQERMPPVLHVDVEDGACTYAVEGSHDMSKWHTYYSGSATQLEKDLIPGVRFWRITRSANDGQVTAAVGPVPDRNGQNVQPRIVTPWVVPG